MNEYVADTHSLLWYLLNLPALGKQASAAFDEADNGNALIHIPAIVFAELFYLNVKLKNQIDFAVEFQKIGKADNSFSLYSKRTTCLISIETRQ